MSSFTDALTYAQARHRSFASVAPVLYLSIVALSLTLLSLSEGILSTGAMAAVELPIIVLAVWRSIWWARHGVDDISEAMAERRIRTVGWVVVSLAGLLIAWSLTLCLLGDADINNGVTFVLCLIFMNALFWTVHLRSTSIAILMMAFPLLIIMLLTRSPHHGPILAIAFVISVCAMLPRTFQLGADYKQLIESHAELVRTQQSMLAKTAEAQRLSEENWRIANTDMLTGLGNRRRFFARLASAYAEGRTGHRGLVLGVLGLDGFKTINDSHDHSVGDQFLRAIAERLLAALGSTIEPFRLGSDEFGIILRNRSSEDELMALGARLIDLVRTPVIIGDLRLTVGCSIGFAGDDDGVRQAGDLYERADYALHFAKRSGRHCATVFNEGHTRAVREAARIEQSLRDADLEAELGLQFQPIVDVRDGQTRAFECLARWNSPTLGPVPPNEFIMVAEKCGLITTITPILLRKALAAAKDWPERIGCTFNLSGHDVASTERISNLIAVVARSGVPPGRLVFEVTETAVMMNISVCAANLLRLKQMGARVALDDFGTGYSSLSYIQQLPLDKIKVDGSFVRDLGNSAASRKIVRSIAALSRDLDLECVVEGVETQEQLELVKDIGCYFVQGYLYARPMNADDVQNFLHVGPRRGVAATAA